MDEGARRSPNHDARGGARVDMVVLHYTVLPAAEALDRLCDPKAEPGPVSAHWLIERGGALHALVDEERRAWHAGRSRWGGTRDVNAASVGIELENDGAGPFPERQIEALVALLGAVMRRHDVPPERVLGHSDVSVGRKIDPGPRFPWRRLADHGLAVWPEVPGLADPATLDASLLAMGYAPEAHPACRLRAMRLRFRPGEQGPPDARDAGIAAAVASRWPATVAPPRRAG